MTSTTATSTPIGPDSAVDLHLHTLSSDGFWTVEALFEHLAANDFRVVAVCDHDTQRSVPEATRLGAERGIVVVPGVEMTTSWNDRQWHVLVFGIAPDRADDASAAFRACLADIAQLLHDRATDARERIEGSGKPLPSLEEVRGDRPLTPFHVLSAAIKDGHAKALKDAAEMVVALGGNFTADLPLGRVVDAARLAGGLSVMAHPGRSDSVGAMTAEDLDRMIAAGIRLDGLEAHYRSYTDAQTALYRKMAEDHGMLISCGSDSHAAKQPVDPRPWRACWCADLLARLGVDVRPVAETAEIWAEGMDPDAAKPPEETPEVAAAEGTADAGPDEAPEVAAAEAAVAARHAAL